MPIRTIRDDEALDSIWEELVFTEARLLGDTNAKEFAASITDLIARLERVHGGQHAVWRDEVAAWATVAAVDDRLDDWVRSFDLTLLQVLGGDAQSPRYRRYFSATPSSIIRLGLESELTRVRSWAASLRTEPEALLQEAGTRLQQIILDGDAALKRRRQAAGARFDHRVRDITALIDDINGARRSLYGTLVQKAAELKLPRDWADRFFQHTSRRAKAQPEPVPTQGN